MSEPSSSDHLSPSDLSQHKFSTSFRGYDPTEVRVVLQQVGRQLELAAEREAELRRRVADLESDLDAAERERHPQTDDGGRAEGGARAGASAGTGTDDAALAAARAEAAEVLAAARAEAEKLVSQANDEAAKLLLRARVEARNAMTVPVTAPPDDVPPDLDAAREHARAMVAEAREFRERVLTDLAKRRRVAHVQLEQLRAAKEKLLESLREARRMVDDTARDLSTADVEARVAADLAGKRVSIEPMPSVFELEAELQTARQFAIPLSSARAAARPAVAPFPPVDAPAPATDEIATADAADAADAAEPAEAVPTEPAGVAESPGAIEPASAPHDDAEPDETGPTDGASVDGTLPEAATAPGEDAPAPDDAGIWGGEFTPTTRVRDDSALLTMRERLRRAAEAEREASAPTPADEPQPVRTARIEDLFARLRAEREAAAASAREVLADQPATDGAPAVAAAAAVALEDAPVPAPDAAPDVVGPADAAVPFDLEGEPGATPLSPDDEALLRRRDLALELVDARLTRGLRRTLQDEHSAVLAALRTARGRVTAAGLLPGLDDHRRAYAALLVPALVEAAQSGSVMGTSLGGTRAAPDAAGIGTAHGARLSAALTASLRSKIDAAVGNVGSAEANSAQLIDEISAAYREWRSERVARFVGDALAAAFAEGLFGTVADGAPVYWILDDGPEPCSECDDNVLAGPVGKATAFPTGHVAPPAHGGCRCLVVPAPG